MTFNFSGLQKMTVSINAGK